MANISISPKNHNQNAPWWWKRLETALVFFFTGLIPILGLSHLIPEDWKKEICLVVLPGLIYLVKTIGIGIGSPATSDTIINQQDVQEIKEFTTKNPAE